ncbi:MAG: hypothetical protein QW524_01940 [Candidatus Woesearchaeota archaeon]
MNYNILKEYDIRGIWGSEFTKDDVIELANTLNRYYKPKTVVIGKDIRLGSEEIAKYLISIFKKTSKVYYLSTVPTPMLYFANFYLNCDLGFMITASHNPKEYNGMKILYKLKNLSKKELLEILKNHSIPLNEEILPESIEPTNILPDYLNFLSKYFNKTKISAIVDAMNGCGYIDGKILSEFITVVPLHFTPLPNFPITPDPSDEKNLSQVVELCKSLNKIGIAFDGDCDRIRVVTESGYVVPNDLITALILKYKPIKKCVITLNTSDIVREIAKERGITLYETRVGRNFVREFMEKEDCDFGSEVSGHFFFKEFNYFDSGLFAALSLIKIIDQEKKQLDDLIYEFRKYEKVEFAIVTEKGDELINSIKEKFSKQIASEMDGILIRTPDFWFNVRKSNTEPKVRFYLECKKKGEIEKIKSELLDLASKFVKN